MRFDVIISGAQICDGKRESFRGDVGVSAGKITAVTAPGALDGSETEERVTAEGLTLMPGFIDTHTHTDLVRLAKPGREDALRQGVTTEITGACGIGCYPLRTEDAGYLESVKGLYGRAGAEFCFPGLDAYFSALPACGVNTAAQVSHSPIRQAVLGNGDLPADAKALDRMRGLLKDAFDEGACAFSTGLAYYPASFGDTAEFTALAAAAAACGAPVTVHRRTALRTAEPFDNVSEVLRVGRESGARMVFSHHRTNYTNYGCPEKVFGPMDRARAEGMEVTADTYPYPVGCGYTAVKLPMWVMDGGIEAILRRLREEPARIARELEKQPGIEDGRICHAPATPELVGLSYAEAAERLGCAVGECLRRILLKNRLETAYMPLLRNVPMEIFEQDFAELFAKTYFMGGSDALPELALRHPRCTGTFPKLLRIFRERGLGPAAAANRLAALPAETYSLSGRGRIAEGYWADLVLLDWEKVRERSDFASPELPPEGIERVYVNGAEALRGGVCTGTRAGRALRRGMV